MTPLSQARPHGPLRLRLGIEAGATHTVAILANDQDQVLARVESGPANVRLLNDQALHRHLQEIARDLPRPSGLAIGMAGARTTADRDRIRRAAQRVWPGVPCVATNDLETALRAAGTPARRSNEPNPSSARTMARVLVLSGTGSCCFGRYGKQTAKVGGWGHILGDKGSGYEIGLRSLKAVVYYFDRDGRWPELGRDLLRASQLNEPNDLIDWVRQASKADIARLAVEVFLAWDRKDPVARDILEAAAQSLTRDAIDCARRLVKAGAPVQFVLAGGVLLRQTRFAQVVSRRIRRQWRGAVISPLDRESVWGAVELAGQPGLLAGSSRQADGKSQRPTTAGSGGGLNEPERRELALSPTEQRNPRSMGLDKLPLPAAIDLMLQEDRRITKALMAEKDKIARAVRMITKALKRKGRLFYVGAGTSGRLGVLDASECPPTFQTDPTMVQGIIAGGQRALWEAVEGAEDDRPAGARAMEFRGVRSRDTVVGIAASGRTPFVRGALREAKRRGARTILLSFNPNLRLAPGDRPDLCILPKIGPEILTGSTRLKAGTATKLVLNIFTTLAMVRLGKVLSNLMIDVKASNEKLRDRAVRILCELTGVDAERARTMLVKSQWKIKDAWRKLRRA
ncbi:MAG TPA: N-acetylmuramic acid 6-phosphate etherase [Verrucomicrobiae bacterium]|nr:N-acetylmuramic acid 6-phosphate etherase [Verrucomicrobiae bacterium]